MPNIRKKPSPQGATSAPKATAKKVAAKAAASPAAKKLTATPQASVKKAPARKLAAPAKPVQKEAEKLKKPKMVRDSFSIPKAEYAVLDALKLRASKLGQPAKKTELLRAGIKVLAALSDTVFLAALKGVPSLKSGRPAKAKAAK